MVSFTTLFTALTAAVGTFAMPVSEPEPVANAEMTLIGRDVPVGQGTHGGYFYSFWSDGQGQVDFNNLAGGRYEVDWSGNGNWVGGKGWQTGTRR